MSEYVYPKEALPEMEYDEPEKKKHCHDCRNSAITNPGAIRPGLECKVMVRSISAPVLLASCSYRTPAPF